MNTKLLLKIVKMLLAFLIALAFSLVIIVKLINLNPKSEESVSVDCQNSAPLFEGEELKILSWNIQYFASKNYVFFYDMFDGSGPDTKPSLEHVTETFNETVRIILAENPDVIFLQEVDEGARRTNFENQTKRLVNLLNKSGKNYPCVAETFYWKSAFIPHPKIMGPVGLKLVILSKYKITDGKRFQLPIATNNYFTKSFYFKRALLSVEMPMKNAKALTLITTHFDAFEQGTDTMERQVKYVMEHVKKLDEAKKTWILGGDFNLLGSEISYTSLASHQRVYFKTPSELTPLIKNYKSIPSVEDITGPDANNWTTYFSNDPSVKFPDRTIDYLFYSEKPDLTLISKKVRRDDTLKISDHLPIISVFKVL